MSEARQELSENYQYWRRNGKRWKQEVERRRSTMPVYHLQEMFLIDYVRRCGPIKILEFGCGFGRHLEYLRTLDGVEIYGFEQSRSMANQMDWASESWKDRHVIVGDPLQKLPFADGFFDLVFTVSVLIHMGEEDVSRVLPDLLRVSNWQILHIENNRTSHPRRVSEMHEGCWEHDLGKHYAAEGFPIEVLPKYFAVEDIYRVVRDPSRDVPSIDSRYAKSCLRLDESISGGIRDSEGARLRSKRKEESYQKRILALEERAEAAESELAGLRERATSAESQLGELRQRSLEAEAELGPLRERAASAESQLAAFRDRAVRAEETLRVSNESITTLRSEVRQVLSASSQIESALGREREMRAKTESEMTALRSELDTSLRQLASLRGALASVLRW